MSDSKKTAGTLKKILTRIHRYRGVMVLSLLMAVIHVLMTLYIPILIGQGIDCIPEAGNVDFHTLKWLITRIVVCAGIGALCQWVMDILNNRITYRVTKDIRDEMFCHIQQLPLSYLDGKSKGDIVSRVISDVDTFADGLLMGFTQLFSGAITIAGTLILMLCLSWRIALVVLVVTPLSLLAARFIAKRTYSMFQLQSKTRGEQTSVIEETIGQMKVVRAFGHEKAALTQFDEVNKRLEQCSLKAIFFSSITNPSTRFVNSLVYTGVAFVGAVTAIQGGISVGSLTCFLSYANQYTKPFNEISGVITELQNAVACAGRIFDLIEQPTYRKNPDNPKQPDKISGEVEIEHLKFSYTPEIPLIEDLNLSVQPGQRVAIVGPTGCGKTTFINLLMRFYDPQEGRICLDGINTMDMERKQLRRSVGMVLQDTWLRSGTIRENIAMGKPDATDDQIVEAARAAHAHGFIMRLPMGYDTVIQESGGDLSQGQKQLLCIARVMLCLPPMLFLDEATSSIDTRTEVKIQKAFHMMMKGRTSFIVAHRLSTIENADLILVMRNGKIVERGNHQELLAKNAFYAELYNSQFAH